jgi:hypothetical protein
MLTVRMAAGLGNNGEATSRNGLIAVFRPWVGPSKRLLRRKNEQTAALAAGRLVFGYRRAPIRWS